MLHAGGPFVAGWPVKLDGLSINILPLIGPGHNVAVGDLDPSPGLEVAASLTTSNLVLFRPDGTRLRDMDPSAHGALSDTAQDNSSVLNLFEYPAIGDLDRDGKLDLAKVGVTLNGLVNLVLVGQNEPFHHVLQAWTGATGQPLEGFPKVIDDFGLTTVPLLANVGATVDPGDTLNLPELVSANGLYLVHAFDFTSRDPGSNTVPIPTSPIPGDDLYCGTAARFDFRFSLAGPITTQAAFDVATPVAAPPTPPRGNHDGGTSLVVGDPGFGGHVVYLAVQIVDHVGNLSPQTSLGSFDFVPPTTTTSTSTTTTLTTLTTSTTATTTSSTSTSVATTSTTTATTRPRKTTTTRSSTSTTTSSTTTTTLGTCRHSGATCSQASECCSGTCRGKSGGRTCK